MITVFSSFGPGTRGIFKCKCGKGFDPVGGGAAYEVDRLGSAFVPGVGVAYAENDFCVGEMIGEFFVEVGGRPVNGSMELFEDLCS